jgi:excisionase family DNA binding protein
MSESLLKLYTIKEVADHLQLSPEHLRRLVRSKKITGRKLLGRWVFSPIDINNFIESK